MTDPTRPQLIQQYRNAYEDAKGYAPPRAKLASFVGWEDEEIAEEIEELHREKAMAEALERGVLDLPTRSPAERLMDAQDVIAEMRDARERGWMFKGDDGAVDRLR